MKRTLFHLLCIQSLLISAQDQDQEQEFEKNNIDITGSVIDKDTQEPLEYATIAFYDHETQEVITGGITNEKGTFKIEVESGIYDIHIEFISFKTKKLISKKLIKNTSLGTIQLALDTETLDDVVVVAEKPDVEIKLDKRVYNVGKDLTTGGATVSDVLDNVPSITVDVDGAVALRGNDDVRILINGKPSGLVGLNGSDALRQLPSDAIERVEVITSPSARYDAAGTAGILNIILKRNKLQGLNGSVTLNSGYPFSLGTSGNLNYRTGDINFFTNTGYNYREIPGNSLSETRFFNIDDDGTDNPDTFLTEDRDFDRERKGFNTNVGIEWYLTETSSITSSFLYRFSDNNNNTTNIITESDLNGDILSQNIRFDPEVEDDITKQLSVNYTKDFKKSGHTLTLDVQIEDSEEDERSAITQENISTIELVNTLEKQKRLLLQSDYVLPLGKNSQFELGYRGSFRELDTDFLVEFDDNGNVVTDTNLSNNLIYTQNVNAAYTQFGSKIGKLSYLLGLRLENTELIIDQRTSNDFNKRTFTDLFPTINLGFEISENQSILLGYNRRIRRPRSRFVNPFPSRSSATNLFQGNPNLDPSYANAFDLGYLNKIGKITLNTSLYYTHATEVFTFISEDTGETVLIGADENNPGTEVAVIRRTPINLADSYRYGFEFTVSYAPSRRWRMNGNFNASQNNFRGENNGESLNNDNFSWFARFNNKLRLPAKIDWQTTLFYRGPRERPQTEDEGIFSMNMAFGKDLFKEKASLTFNINDIFNSRIRKRTAATPTFISDRETQSRVRRFNLSFTYRFNQFKKRRKRKEEENIDEEFEG